MPPKAASQPARRTARRVFLLLLLLIAQTAPQARAADPHRPRTSLTLNDTNTMKPLRPPSQQAYFLRNGFFGASIAVAGDTLAIGAPLASEVVVFVRTGSTWTLQAVLKGSKTTFSGSFGRTVAISGDTLVVGSRYENSGDIDAGAAYVFVRSGSTWTEQAYLTAPIPKADAHFGHSVAVAGDTVLVGTAEGVFSTRARVGTQTDGDTTNVEPVYVFARDGTTWTLQATLEAPIQTQGLFGWSVALAGNTAVVGNLNRETVYVFERDGTTWTQQAILKASNQEINDNFGYSVAITGNTVVVGAPSESSSASGVNGNQADNSSYRAGAAYVFVRSDTTWTQQAYLKASNPNKDNSFGSSVAITGERVVIGAPGESSSATGVNGDQTNNSYTRSGAAYVFVRSGSTWTQQAYLKRFDSRENGAFGFGEAVAAAEDTVAVGAPYSLRDSDLGAGYVFAPRSVYLPLVAAKP